MTIESILNYIPPFLKTRTMHAQLLGILLGAIMYALPELEAVRVELTMSLTALTLMAMYRFTASNGDATAAEFRHEIEAITDLILVQDKQPVQDEVHSTDYKTNAVTGMGLPTDPTADNLGF